MTPRPHFSYYPLPETRNAHRRLLSATLRVARTRHKSILEYLHTQNFTEAFNALQAEANVDYTPDPKSKYSQLLEKKWTSVIRLQKKVRLLFNSIVTYSTCLSSIVAHYFGKLTCCS